ncbi:hypothetical protein BDB00DRAFT_872182 [Zychaea mexicana]|uniref:uncharacterized protein n=1 Tax=Zychaea mexicana TaxID=64656 RepID=UPI0022FEE770|nr:uncharacterized protein BDB00DRAFT_872182 [Zychaea mexicana]KAI9493712.1 hypothetical protein BDB00DRAFT_872182 [Zychaea mexicana]
MADNEAANEGVTGEEERTQQEAQDYEGAGHGTQDSTSNIQRASYSRIKSLHSLLEALLRSPNNVRDKPSCNRCTNSRVPAKEIATVQRIANALLPSMSDDNTPYFPTSFPSNPYTGTTAEVRTLTYHAHGRAQGQVQFLDDDNSPNT